jgi:hypothetical protein
MAILMPDLTVDVYNADTALSRIRWQEAVADLAGCGVCHRRARPAVQYAVSSPVTCWPAKSLLVVSLLVTGPAAAGVGGHLDAFFLGM